MDGNLLAGIFDAREQIESWRAAGPLPDCPMAIAEPPIAVTSVPTTTASSVFASDGTTNFAQTEHPAGSPSSGESHVPAPAASAQSVQSALGELYTVAVGGVVQKTDGATMLSKAAHVEFGIAVTRLCDGSSRTLYRRFRDIKQFYFDLIAMYPQIEANAHIKFPLYDSWLSSSSSDPYSELVVRRKVDLQAFFSELFQQYPKLFQVPMTKRFLEIDQFPPRSVSSYSALYCSGDDPMMRKLHIDVSDTDIIRFEHLDAPNVEYDVSKGRLVKKEAQQDWVSYDGTVEPMSLVEFLSFADAEKARKEKERLNREKLLVQQQQAAQAAQSAQAAASGPPPTASTQAKQHTQAPAHKQPAPMHKPAQPPVSRPLSQ